MRIPIRRVFRGTSHRRKLLPNASISPAIEDLLSQPTWSVRSLLPPTSSPSSDKDDAVSKTASTAVKSAAKEEEITREKLHHLLKLSALPLPKTEKEESKMLKTLRDQVHFVRSIQSVNTEGVKPLITIRDETPEAVREETIDLKTMMPYLALEEKVGRNGTVRRRDVVRTPEEDARERSEWAVDAFDLGKGSEERRRGKFFYVKRTKQKTKAGEVVVDESKNQEVSERAT